MDAALIIEWIIKSILLLVICITGFAYLTFYERKALARLQVRIGPNRAGPFGLLQPVADGIKLIFKEELIPEKADRLIFVLAPVVTVVPALVVLAVLPFGGVVNLFGREISLSVAGDVNIGILYITAITSISVYGIVLAGWSSNNKYAAMGGIRSTAQMISYELALGLGFIGPILLAGTMSLNGIVEGQRGMWYVVYQPLGVLVFMIATLAEVNRAPFDMPEAEQELTAGYHTEYSGMKFALFFMAEYVKMIAVSAIAATLFFGGYRGPFIDQVPWLGPIYLLIKVMILLFGMIWVRATLPRLRYDQLMAFGWKILLPVALLNVLLTAGVIMLFPGLGV
ncbi:MAG: nuoH [Chloroflexi bacterium]|jgi:NADH-quinone oxidoreductase subunit H|nr:nuoH [Chloroflexota bacterium]